MSHLISRILLTILMLPLAAIAYTVVFVVGDRLSRRGNFPFFNHEVTAFVGSGVIVWGLIAVYWLLLWGRGIRWTTRRIHLTWLAGVASALVAAILGAALYGLVNIDEFAAFVASALAPMAWLAATILIWRETREERAARVHAASADTLVCPACGYNLTGLSEARCPECGATYTLSDLVAAQPSREVAAAENEMATS